MIIESGLLILIWIGFEFCDFCGSGSVLGIRFWSQGQKIKKETFGS
jgi:hypothetical protein